MNVAALWISPFYFFSFLISFITHRFSCRPTNKSRNETSRTSRSYSTETFKMMSYTSRSKSKHSGVFLSAQKRQVAYNKILPGDEKIILICICADADDTDIEFEGALRIAHFLRLSLVNDLTKEILKPRARLFLKEILCEQTRVVFWPLCRRVQRTWNWHHLSTTWWKSCRVQACELSLFFMQNFQPALFHSIKFNFR